MGLSGTAPDRQRTAAAAERNKQLAAERALDDPAKLERAARLIRLALERGRLAPADILPDADRAAS